MVDAMVLAQWVVNVGRRDAQARLAHLLCEMACRYRSPQVQGTVVYTLPMTQVQLADATGLTPVHINRTLKKLGEIGTTFRNATVRIENWARLVDVGEFTREYLQDGLEPGERLRFAG